MSLNRENRCSVDMSLRKASIIAGIGLLLMAVLAPIANFNALQNLIVRGDSAATFSKIMASIGLFRTGICLFLIVSILDVIVAWALYVLFKPVNKSLSLLSALFRIVYAAIFAIALNNLFYVLQLMSGADYLKVFEANQLRAQVMLYLESFQSGWNIGMVIFGLHLLLLGYLVSASRYFPKFLGILIVAAGLGYLMDSFGKLFISDYNMTITLFTFIGEVLLIFWLFLRGIKGFGKEFNAN
jgi:hypothetical protein